eukprot:g2981.t1
MNEDVSGKTTNADDDNIWTKSNGGKLTGDEGNRFISPFYAMNHATHYFLPLRYADMFEDEKGGMNTRPYWYLRVLRDEESRAKIRLRFNMMTNHWFMLLLFAVSSFGVTSMLQYENVNVDGEPFLASIADFATLLIVIGCMPSFFMFFPRSLRIAKTTGVSLLDVNSIAFGVCHWALLMSMAWIGVMGNWLIVRFSPMFIEAAFLLLPGTASHGQHRTATWYSGKTRRSLGYAAALVVPFLVDTFVLRNAPNGFADVFALSVFGFSMVGLTVLKKRIRNHDKSTKSASVRFAVAIWCFVCAVFARVLVIRLLAREDASSLSFMPPVPANSFESLVVGTDDRNDEGYSLLGIRVRALYNSILVLLLAFTARNQRGRVLMGGREDPVACNVHVQSLPFALLAFMTTFIFAVMRCLWHGFYEGGIALGMIYWICSNYFGYASMLTTNVTEKLDRKPVGENAEDMCCDDTFTTDELRGELALGSAFVTASHLFGALFFGNVGRILINLASGTMHGKLRFYCHKTPIVDLEDEGVLTGISYCVTPKDMQQKPAVFVCNVGHMKMMTENNSDWKTTNMHTYRMVQSLAADPEAGKKGFVSNVISEFHGVATSTSETGEEIKTPMVRQVNLSAWASAKSAHDWYVGNRTHRDIVKMLKNGKSGHGALSSFSSLLAHLSPTPGHPTRWIVKCEPCGAINRGYPETKRCHKCGRGISMRNLM